jgi:hypothetical protein
MSDAPSTPPDTCNSSHYHPSSADFTAKELSFEISLLMGGVVTIAFLCQMLLAGLPNHAEIASHPQQENAQPAPLAK